MFDKIVESVLNEISAEDAYNKFYNKMPKEDFDRFVEAYGGKFDNFLKTVLNSILTNGFSYKRGFDLIKKYKSVPNEVRIKFLQNLKSGQYEDLLDMEQGLQELQNNGVDTLKSIQTMGLIKLLDDERYTITCTTTYSANHHFYGDSKWCTASDRLGRYDGWHYFLSYIYDIDADVIEEITENKSNSLITKHTPVASLVQFVHKKTNKKFQIQLFIDGSFGQICDYEDEGCDIDELPMPFDLRKLLKEKAKELVESSKKAIEREFPYQSERDTYIKNKREVRAAIIQKMGEECVQKLGEIASKKGEFISTKFFELFTSNLLTNPQFLTQLANNSALIEKKANYESSPEEKKKIEELIMSQKYAMVSNVSVSDRNVCAIRIAPVFGLTKYIEYNSSNGYPYLGDIIILENYWYQTLLDGGVVVIATTTTDTAEMEDIEFGEVLKVSKFPDSRFSVNNLHDLCSHPINYTWGSALYPYFIIQYLNEEEGSVAQLFSIETNKTLTFDGHYNESIAYNGYLLLKQSGFFSKTWVLIDTKSFSITATLSAKFFSGFRAGFQIAKDEKDNLYILSNELINLGKEFENVSINDIESELIPDLGIIRIWCPRLDYSSELYDIHDKKIICRNTQFYYSIPNKAFAEFKNGERITLTGKN